MTESDFWSAVAIARANNEGKTLRRSVTRDFNLVCEALCWLTLPPSIPEKKIDLAPTEAERLAARSVDS